jgi:thiol:disulfide interchange protein DsbD
MSGVEFMTKILTRLFLLLSVAFSLIGGSVRAQEFLPADKAFQLKTDFDPKKSRVQIQISAVEGYYLYQESIQVKSETQGVSVKQPLVLPSAKKKFDEAFNKEVFYYRNHQLKFPIELNIDPSFKKDQVKLFIRYQGCADAGLCYPPVTQRVDVQLPQPQKNKKPEVSESTSHQKKKSS